MSEYQSIVQGKYLANCFLFDQNLTYSCKNQNECENDGRCVQDKFHCPSCYYGKRCQFTTSGFGLSLDGILSYHILPRISLLKQTPIVVFALIITTLLIFLGFVDGILSLMTFKNEAVREVGCGWDLLGSSIMTLVTMILFGLKYFILVYAQMRSIENRTFLMIQCYSIDFLLRTSLWMDQWLNAFVAIERAITAIKGTSFNKKMSKKTAKFVMVILFLIIVGSSIEDPFYRHLIDEDTDYEQMKRTWRVITYPYGLTIYNTAVDSLHFFGPFISNLGSSIVLIVVKSRQQIHLHTERRFDQVFRKQILEYKHLLIGPMVLAAFAVPRLILTFISKCMKSMNDSWIYLIGYFLSFIPSMLTFLIFIAPSKFYKSTEFSSDGLLMKYFSHFNVYFAL